MNAVPTPGASGPAASRLESVDLLRGLIMVIMALDHTRDFLHFGAVHGVDPTNLAVTTPWIFFTRWITHICAPVFSFLAGTGAALAAARGKSPGELSRFLVTRGLWLIAIELTYGFVVVMFALPTQFNMALVLWQLGWSMIVLAALIRLPTCAIATAGLVVIAGHNAFDAVKPEAWGAAAWLWRILHVQGPAPVASGYLLIVAYPLIPWVGVMACGYALGSVYRLESCSRRWLLWGLGAGITVAFFALRFANVYGDPRPWSVQARPGFTLLSFLNCTKYPPSLSFLLMTLGPAILMLAWADGRPTRGLLRPALVYGRVPLFYYLIHMPLAHGLAVGINWLDSRWPGPAGWAGRPPPEAGASLITVYLVWIVVVVAMYPLCVSYACLKQRSRAAWLRYF